MLYEVIRRLNFMKTRKLLILATSIVLCQSPGKAPETLTGAWNLYKIQGASANFLEQPQRREKY